MKAPDESGINKDFTEKSTDWIATDDKRCTDGVAWIILTGLCFWWTDVVSDSKFTDDVN